MIPRIFQIISSESEIVAYGCIFVKAKKGLCETQEEKGG